MATASTKKDQQQSSNKQQQYGNTVIHGTNPQNLIDKIVRNKIYNCAYWKEHCFGLTAETIIDKAMNLDAIGGTYGGMRKPSKFICLLLKMLQIQIEPDIIAAYIENEHYKYVTALGAMYLRITGKPTEIYQHLERLYSDYRKVRRLNLDGTYTMSHVDEFVEELLTGGALCDVQLPYLPRRKILEDVHLLFPRISALEIMGEIDAYEPASSDKQQEHAAATSEEALRLKFKKRPREDDVDEFDDAHKRDAKNTNEMSIEQSNKIRAELGLKPLEQ